MCQHWHHQKSTDIPMEALKCFDQIKGIRWFCDNCSNPVKLLLDNKDSNKDITKAVESIAELNNGMFDIKATLKYTSSENEPSISVSNEVRISGIPECRKIDNNQKSINCSGHEIFSFECLQLGNVLEQLEEHSTCSTNIKKTWEV